MPGSCTSMRSSLAHGLRVQGRASRARKHLSLGLSPSASCTAAVNEHPGHRYRASCALDFTAVIDSGEGTEWKWIADVNSYLAGEKD